MKHRFDLVRPVLYHLGVTPRVRVNYIVYFDPYFATNVKTVACYSLNKLIKTFHLIPYMVVIVDPCLACSHLPGCVAPHS